MRVHIVLTTTDGETFEGDAILAASEHKRPRRTRSVRTTADSDGHTVAAPDFALPLRAFVKRYANSLNGGEKFAALVARLTGGKSGVEVSRKDIEKNWNRMTGSLGDFNPAYSTRARDNGWVDSGSKPGSYVLVPGWEEVFRPKPRSKPETK